ncbi:uncharacterized protein MONBRDRAFT_22495 [Monosiga brevicollis MX1]|uniref:Uncharacterized protein n=1 Tax=Monosiga brevicollis TaxID=81824 RepID=A9UQR7_MONBE|nr:uncharacterized protein MONBRDRAFT_22495 [Monosiga brevicollis MX1]EDQ92645.1 predicted protein [Monosiga brevicollis MX1]|eukprot:XP_001742407.1 hypothetical protein [Monosiga brevicollis MX1]
MARWLPHPGPATVSQCLELLGAQLGKNMSTSRNEFANLKLPADLQEAARQLDAAAIFDVVDSQGRVALHLDLMPELTRLHRVTQHRRSGLLSLFLPRATLARLLHGLVDTLGHDQASNDLVVGVLQSKAFAKATQERGRAVVKLLASLLAGVGKNGQFGSDMRGFVEPRLAVLNLGLASLGFQVEICTKTTRDNKQQHSLKVGLLGPDGHRAQGQQPAQLLAGAVVPYMRAVASTNGDTSDALTSPPPTWPQQDPATVGMSTPLPPDVVSCSSHADSGLDAGDEVAAPSSSSSSTADSAEAIDEDFVLDDLDDVGLDLILAGSAQTTPETQAAPLRQDTIRLARTHSTADPILPSDSTAAPPPKRSRPAPEVTTSNPMDLSVMATRAVHETQADADIASIRSDLLSVDAEPSISTASLPASEQGLALPALPALPVDLVRRDSHSSVEEPLRSTPTDAHLEASPVVGGFSTAVANWVLEMDVDVNWELDAWDVGLQPHSQSQGIGLQPVAAPPRPDLDVNQTPMAVEVPRSESQSPQSLARWPRGAVRFNRDSLQPAASMATNTQQAPSLERRAPQQPFRGRPLAPTPDDFSGGVGHALNDDVVQLAWPGPELQELQEQGTSAQGSVTSGFHAETWQEPTPQQAAAARAAARFQGQASASAFDEAGSPLPRVATMPTTPVMVDGQELGGLQQHALAPRTSDAAEARPQQDRRDGDGDGDSNHGSRLSRETDNQEMTQIRSHPGQILDSAKVTHAAVRLPYTDLIAHLIPIVVSLRIAARQLQPHLDEASSLDLSEARVSGQRQTLDRQQLEELSGPPGALSDSAGQTGPLDGVFLATPTIQPVPSFAANGSEAAGLSTSSDTQAREATGASERALQAQGPKQPQSRRDDRRDDRLADAAAHWALAGEQTAVSEHLILDELSSPSSSFLQGWPEAVAFDRLGRVVGDAVCMLATAGMFKRAFRPQRDRPASQPQTARRASGRGAAESIDTVEGSGSARPSMAVRESPQSTAARPLSLLSSAATRSDQRASDHAHGNGAVSSLQTQPRFQPQPQLSQSVFDTVEGSGSAGPSMAVRESPQSTAARPLSLLSSATTRSDQRASDHAHGNGAVSFLQNQSQPRLAQSASLATAPQVKLRVRIRATQHASSPTGQACLEHCHRISQSCLSHKCLAELGSTKLDLSAWTQQVIKATR